MKTKTIFKTLALAMMMPAMLLTTACSSDDDSIINNENTNKKGFTLPVTVNVTRQGDANTRATYNESTKKLSFSAGDQLFVTGWDPRDDGAGEFAGLLTWVSDGTFSGTITTENEYSGTAEQLFAAATSSHAHLLPNGYETYRFLNIIERNGYSNYISQSDYPKNLISLTKAEAVEQFSYEYCDGYSNGFTLIPMYAILGCTITGLEPNADVNVTLYCSNEPGTYNLPVETGVVTTDGSGTATFFMGMTLNYTTFNRWSLTINENTIDENTFTFTSTFDVEGGHIYNITKNVPLRSISTATTGDEGKVVCAAGHLHYAKNAVPSGCTAVGILGKVTETGHGLILALENATNQTWNTIDGWTSETTYAGTTLKLLPDDAARGSLTSYTTLGSIPVSNWAVAQKSNYAAIFNGLGSSSGSIAERDYDNNVNDYITNGVGGTELSGTYWSATSYKMANYSWCLRSNGWGSADNSTSYQVRPVLAF